MKTLITALALAAATQSPALAQTFGWDGQIRTNRRTMVREQKGTTMKTLITALTLAALIAATQSPALAQWGGYW